MRALGKRQGKGGAGTPAILIRTAGGPQASSGAEGPQRVSARRQARHRHQTASDVRTPLDGHEPGAVQPRYGDGALEIDGAGGDVSERGAVVGREVGQGHRRGNADGDVLETRNDEEAAAVAQAEQDAETQTVACLARRFTALMRAACRTAESDHAAAGLEAWLTEASSCGITAVQTFAAGLEQDGAPVRGAFTLPWSSRQAEGQINRLKMLKRQMYGRASLDLLRRRALMAA